MSFSNITNIYELLDQDGEEGVARLPPKKEVVAPKPAAPATKSATPAVKSAQQSSFNKGSSPRGERRQGDGQRRDNRPRPPRQQGGDQQQGETERQPVEGARRDRPADRQQAREKGESRGDEYRRNAPAGGFVGNKRVYDRKSGTGRGDGQGRENKRAGRGKGGWGDKDGSDVVNEAIKDLAKEGENIIQGEGVHDNKGTDAAAEKLEAEQTPKEETEEEKKKREEREKEEKQLSFSDYQKQLAEKKAQSALLQTQAAAQRKANEGVDDKTAKKWGSYEQIKRDEAPKQEEKKTDSKAAKKQTVRLDELFTIKEAPKPQYNSDRDDRRGKDGKGKFEKKGGNQNRKQGGNQSGQQTQTQHAAADDKPIFDSSSFPTLIKN